MQDSRNPDATILTAAEPHRMTLGLPLRKTPGIRGSGSTRRIGHRHTELPLDRARAAAGAWTATPLGWIF